MDEREYIERWIKRLVDFRTQEYSDVNEASGEIEETVIKHLRQVCKKVEEKDFYAKLDEDLMPELVYYIQCDNKIVEMYVSTVRKISLEIADVYIYEENDS
jgi:pantothenate kinase-related protein Tda10